MSISEGKRRSEEVDDAEELLDSESFCIATESSASLLPS
jgi:hypothetical protein